MAQAHTGDRVKVHYTGTLDDGRVFDTSEEGEPLEFTIGGNEVIRGFEQTIVGMEPGETRKVTIASADAYGPHRQEMVAEVERSRFPDDLDFRVGQQLQIEHEDGRTLLTTITAVTDSTVTIDANHPLAGEDLTFKITLVSIMADPCELDQG